MFSFSILQRLGDFVGNRNTHATKNVMTIVPKPIRGETLSHPSYLEQSQNTTTDMGQRRDATILTRYKPIKVFCPFPFSSHNNLRSCRTQAKTRVTT